MKNYIDRDIKNLQNCVIMGQFSQVDELIRTLIDDGVKVELILKKGLIEAMAEVGKRYEGGLFFIPEMLLAAKAMQAGLAIIRPYLIASGVELGGKIILGAVKGDLHDIGKDLVGTMFEGAGFEVIDLGTDVSAEKFVQAVKENHAEIVGMSALLTTTMQNIGFVIEALEDAGLRGSVKVIVGGAPLTEEFANEIGADGYAPDASTAVTLVKSLQ